MKEEKFGQGKLFVFFDWMWRLFVLNILTIITSLGIVTIIPATIACFKSIKDCQEQYTSKIIVPYFRNFVTVFKETVWLGIIVIIIVVCDTISIIWYDGVINETYISISQGDLFWFIFSSVGLLILFVITLLILMGLSQLPIIVSYYRFHTMDLIKLSFFMGFKFVMSTMAEILIAMASVTFLVLTVYFESPLMILWVTFGISLPHFARYYLSRRQYQYLFGQGNINDIAHVDIQGNHVVRESYEDRKKTD